MGLGADACLPVPPACRCSTTVPSVETRKSCGRWRSAVRCHGRCPRYPCLTCAQASGSHPVWTWHKCPSFWTSTKVGLGRFLGVWGGQCWVMVEVRAGAQAVGRTHPCLAPSVGGAGWKRLELRVWTSSHFPLFSPFPTFDSVSDSTHTAASLRPHMTSLVLQCLTRWTPKHEEDRVEGVEGGLGLGPSE